MESAPVPGTEAACGDQLPVPHLQVQDAVAPASTPTAPPGLLADLNHDLVQVALAVRAMPVNEDSDATLAALAGVTLSGTTAADALDAAAQWCRHAPEARITFTLWSEVPGPREDVLEYRISLITRFPGNRSAPGEEAHQDTLS